LTYSTNEDLKRLFARLSSGSISHDDERLKKISKLRSELENIYAKARVCEPDDNQKCYTLSPYIERVMQTENNYDRLLWAWQGWHDACGNKIRSVYLSFIDLITKTEAENSTKTLAVSTSTDDCIDTCLINFSSLGSLDRRL
jgi:hypothetical protein